MKGLAATVYTVLDAIQADAWDDFAGKTETLGIISGDDMDLNYVQLPIESTQWSDGFTEDDYKAMVAQIADGTIEISDDTSASEPAAETIKVDFQGNIK
jgi:basic membrane protein A